MEVIEHVLVTGQKPGERGGHPDCDAGADRLYPRREREAAREHQPTRQPHSGGRVRRNQQHINILMS